LNLENQCTRKWDEVYNKPLSFARFLEDNLLHIHYLFCVFLCKPRRVLEVGCGSAAHSIFLSKILRNAIFMCVDSNEKVLHVAKINAQKFGAGKVYFKKVNAFQLSEEFYSNEFDVAFSQGLLEHFSNEEIFKLLKEQLNVAKNVIFSIPLENYPFKDLGDERLLAIEEWYFILEKFRRRFYQSVKIKIFKQFDLGIKTRFKGLFIKGIKASMSPMYAIVKVERS